MKREPTAREPGNSAIGIRQLGSEPCVREEVAVLDEEKDALLVLEALAGSIDAPADWAAEHDHYLYGSPKRGESRA